MTPLVDSRMPRLNSSIKPSQPELPSEEDSGVLLSRDETGTEERDGKTMRPRSSE